MDRLTITLNIPVGLCQYVLEKKLFRQFQLFIYLKCKASGTIKVMPEQYKKIADDLGVKSGKTIKNNLSRLLDMNWIGYCKPTGEYYVRGFAKILAITKVDCRHGCEFDFREIKQMKAFICGALVSKLCYMQKWKQISIEQQKGCSVHNRKMQKDEYYPIACNALVKYYGISKGYAFEMKKMAKECNYIVVKSNLELTDLQFPEINHVKRYDPEVGKCLTTRGRYVYMQLPDLVMPCIKIRRSRWREKV